MIGILEVFIIIFALLYYLRLACRLRIEADAESIASTRALRISGITDEANPDDLVD